ncbi:Uncharacterised protein [Mycobacteroides abscessus subsp. abscessus]|nr:Uncharacterised protein [Mycobacteroides abscessus subsp. abscessus]
MAAGRAAARRCAEAAECVVARTSMLGSASRMPLMSAVPILPVPMEAIVVMEVSLSEVVPPRWCQRSR